MLLDATTCPPQNPGRSHRRHTAQLWILKRQFHDSETSCKLFFSPSSSLLNSPQSPADTRRQHTWWKKDTCCGFTATQVRPAIGIYFQKYCCKSIIIYQRSPCSSRLRCLHLIYRIGFTHSNSRLTIVYMLPKISTKLQSTPTDVLFTQEKEEEEKTYLNFNRYTCKSFNNYNFTQILKMTI